MRDVRAQTPRDARQLHVVRHLHRHVVARLQQRERDQVVGFGGAVGDFDLLDVGAGIDRGELLAQLDRPVRLAVAERHVEKGLEVESHLDQLAQRQRTHAALAEVVVDEVLPRRLHPLHKKRFDHEDSLSRIRG